MRTLALVFLILLVAAPAVTAQQMTWWIVISLTADGQALTVLYGSFATRADCNSWLPEIRRSFSIENAFVQSIGCRSNVDVARMMLNP